MQNKLLEKPIEVDKKGKSPKPGAISSNYHQMKDEEEGQTEMSKVQARTMKKVFLSGSEDEEDKSMPSIPPNKQENSPGKSTNNIDIVVYEPPQEQRDSQIGIKEDTIIQNDDQFPPSQEKEDLVRVQPQPSPKFKKKASSKKSAKKTKAKYKYKQVPFKWSTYKFLLQYPKKHWKLTILANLLIVITSVQQAYLPMLIGQLLDSTTSQEKDAKLHRELSIRFLEILLVYSAMQFIRAFINQIWQEQIYNDMREDVLKQFLSFDMNFFNKYRNGEIISRMTNDLQSAKSAVSGNIILLARNTITVLVNIVVLFMLSWKLTLAILSTMPVFSIITMLYSRLAKKFEKIGQDYQARLTTLADEIVSGVITVKSFCAEEKEIKKFRKQLELNMGLAYRRGLNNGFYQGASSLFTQLGSLIVLWYGGLLILEDDDLSPGELASFIFYSMQLTNSSSNISESFAKIVSATGAFEGVLEMLKYESFVRELPDAISHINITGQIQFKNVYFRYPNTNVFTLKGVTLTINRGEYVAFVGCSGSGKSTVARLLERFYDPQQGKILLDNINIKDFKLQHLRRSIGLVSQEPTLFEGTIESNITYGVDNYTENDLEWATKASGVWSFVMDKMNFPNGFKTYVGEQGYTLSGGQKQRIAIARALIKRPSILIFDEATSALDAESEFQVQSAIDDLIQKEDEQITIIVIAHRLSTIVNCSKIVVLQHGQVAEWGTHQQLLSVEGVYRSLVERQIAGVMETHKSDNDGDTEAQ